MPPRRPATKLLLVVSLSLACGQATLLPDGSAVADRGTPDASSDAASNDAALSSVLGCYQGRVTSFVASDGSARWRLRFLATAPKKPFSLDEAQQIVAGDKVSRRTAKLSRVASALTDSAIFGAEVAASAQEQSLCQHLPPIDPFYFLLTGEQEGQPATGVCGHRPGHGGGPRVRTSCGNWPVVDAAISTVYFDPFSLPAGWVQLSVMLRLVGPAQGVLVTPKAVWAVAPDGSEHRFDVGSTFTTFDLQSGEPPKPGFSGTVTASGTVVHLILDAKKTRQQLGDGFCTDGPATTTAPSTLYVEGAVTVSGKTARWVTSGFQCNAQALDVDWAMP